MYLICVDGIRLIQLSRPQKKNAISSDMFIKITQAFQQANAIDSIKVKQGQNDHRSSVFFTALTIINGFRIKFLVAKLTPSLRHSRDVIFGAI